MARFLALCGILVGACSDGSTCPDRTEDILVTTQNTIIDVRAPDGTPVCDATITCTAGPVTPVMMPGGGVQVPCRFQVDVQTEGTINVHREPYRDKTVRVAKPSCPGDRSVVEIRLENP